MVTIWGEHLSGIVAVWLSDTGLLMAVLFFSGGERQFRKLFFDPIKKNINFQSRRGGIGNLFDVQLLARKYFGSGIKLV